MAELIQYQELVPGLRHFDCTRQRALISTATCSARYAEALLNPDKERFDPCRRCPVGTMHSSQQPSDAPEDDFAVAHQELVSADHKKRCTRCGRVASRVIGKTLCPSCWNREREWLKGMNAKGTAPTTYIPLRPRMVGVEIDGRQGYAIVPGTQNDAEPLARLIRARPGIKFHSRRPGRTYWNAHRQAFEWRDDAGQVLLEVDVDGLAEHVAVAQLRPGEAPAPVYAATSELSAKVAATWLRLTESEHLKPEWAPVPHACERCHSSALLARHRCGRVHVACRACGDSASE
jgi:hypothetical protein